MERKEKCIFDEIGLLESTTAAAQLECPSAASVVFPGPQKTIQKNLIKIII